MSWRPTPEVRGPPVLSSREDLASQMVLALPAVISKELTRREQQRVETVRDIKDEALRQLASGALDTVTLSGVARNLRMSVAGLYRYFVSRDDLLAALAGDSYADLADALSDASSGSVGYERLERVANAYRSWALTQPGRYRLIFSSTWGSGRVKPDTTLPDADRAMVVLVDAVRDATAGGRRVSPGATDSTGQLDDPLLAGQLTAWATRALLADVSPDVLLHAVTLWTRLHGIVSLEIEGAWASMGLDAGNLVSGELRALSTGP